MAKTVDVNLSEAKLIKPKPPVGMYVSQGSIFRARIMMMRTIDRWHW